MKNDTRTAGRIKLLTAFVAAIALVATLLLIMAAGIWFYTSQINAREQSLVNTVLPKLDLAYELATVSAAFQNRVGQIDAANDTDELEAYRQSMVTIMDSSDVLMSAMQVLDMDIDDELVTDAADVRKVIDGLAENRASQLSLINRINDATVQLLSQSEALEAVLQGRIIDLTDKQLDVGEIMYAIKAEGDNADVGRVLDSLSAFESQSLSIQDYLLLNQDLVALESVIEQVPLLTTTAAITQASQRRDLLINSMVSRTVHLADLNQKAQVFQGITQLRGSMRGDDNMFSLQQTLIALNTDQQALNLLLSRYLETILVYTDKTRASTRAGLSDATTETLKALSRYRYFLLFIAVVALSILSWIIYSLLYRNTLVPLLDVTRQIEKIGTDGFTSNEKQYPIREMSVLSHMVIELDEAQRDMKAKDRQLKANLTELQKANEDLEQFAHVASHDLQEPLRKLQQFSDLLIEDYEPKLDADGKFFIAAIKSSSARMSELIRDTLIYSRTGRSQESIEPVRLSTLLDSLMTDLELAIGDANAHVHIGELPTVLANRTGMSQLFRNLLLNALKYRKPDIPARITVETELNGVNGGMTIVVQDNGIGISENNLLRIFTPFERLNSDTVRGTGLGLAICAKVCEAHDWQIEAKSDGKTGTRFCIRIPEASIV